MKTPFPYFGGKARIASMVWERFGNVANLVEPFFGSGAVLLARPTEPGIETVNDLDGLVANFWRATQADPDAVAQWADWPSNENDLHARHIWLVGRKEGLQAALEGDADYYDAKVAGWWLWGICQWIGSGWCSGDGPWQVVDGKLVNGGEGGVSRKRVHLGDAGQGIYRQRGHLGDAGQGINRQRVHLGNAGRGINRQADAGTEQEWSDHTQAMMRQLRDRMRRVRVCCGDWSRPLFPSFTKLGLTGVFLDPPYSLEADRDMGLYTVDSGTVAHDVRRWAIEHGDNPLMRIALCGYDGEHAMPDTWEAVAWKAAGGYGNQGDGKGRENAAREVVWFNKSCLPPVQQRLF